VLICPGICSGKSSIAEYLIEEHGFTRLFLKRTSPTPAVEKSAIDISLPLLHKSDIYRHHEPLPEFQDPDSLLNFVTKRWKENWVTTDIWDEGVVNILTRRPFFFLISVDAPITLRWERFKHRCIANNLPPPDLATFVVDNDAHVYSKAGGLALLLHRANLHLLNSSTSIAAFRTALRALDLTNESRIRPSWDLYFMQLADLAARRSNCMKRQVGCVLVREKRVISTGYNGTPRGMRNCGEGGCTFFSCSLCAERPVVFLN
jgi:dCMP deaminase